MILEPWRNLSPEVGDVVEPVLPDVAREILETIGTEIPEYARPLEGAFGRGVHRGVTEALAQFVGLIRDPDAGRAPSREVYIALGRGEFTNGRALDSLQTAYRIGARVAWRRIASASLDAGLDGTTLSLLAESIFVYINELSADSTEGYAEVQSELLGERLRRERQLVGSMLRLPAISPEELATQAAIAGWRVPQQLAALVCHENDLTEITRILPNGVISAPVDGLGCIAVPDASGPGRHRRLKDAIGDRPASIGGDGPPALLRQSWQLARLALEAVDSGVLRSTGLVRAEMHLLDLTLFNSRGLVQQIRSRTLSPLSDLTPKARSRMTDTATAYIEQWGNAAGMARTLQIHPQTARYRVARLRDLFGDRLDDPSERLALELSLRAGTPGRV